MTLGLVIAIVAIVLALGFGAFRLLSDGRFRARRAPDVRGAGTPTPADETSAAAKALDGRLGERATLVQFSSAFCAPCRVTRRVLADVAGATPGVLHVELDAEQHLDLVRLLHITRTPTTLVLDGAGREIARAAGAPRPEQVLSAIPPA